jgi:hypothetical protein
VTELFLLTFTKTCTWNIIQHLIAAPMYREKRYRFYFVDERTPKGKGMRFISGPAHAEYFLELAEGESQGPALATFVRGKGYVEFDGNEGATLPVSTMAKLSNIDYGAEGTEEAKYGK